MNISKLNVKLTDIAKEATDICKNTNDVNVHIAVTNIMSIIVELKRDILKDCQEELAFYESTISKEES